MSATRKALLSCSAICYVLTLFSFFKSELWMILLFFILHSISLMLFAYLTYRDSLDGPYIDPRPMEELNLLKEENSKLSDENVRLSLALDKAKSEQDALSQDYQESKTELESQLSKAKKEALEKDEELAAKSKASKDSLLPPIFTDNGNPEPLDIVKVAQDVIQEFATFSQKAGIQIRVSCASDTLMVKADPSRIRILFRNIIDNSIKYMNRTGNLIITMSTVGDDIFIVLKDNGEGLSEQETPHIFEMNYQGSNRISGNGLGLTQAKAIVESYGGTIYAKSSIGKGMGIYIQIPIE